MSCVLATAAPAIKYDYTLQRGLYSMEEEEEEEYFLLVYYHIRLSVYVLSIFPPVS